MLTLRRAAAGGVRGMDDARLLLELEAAGREFSDLAESRDKRGEWAAKGTEIAQAPSTVYLGVTTNKRPKVAGEEESDEILGPVYEPTGPDVPDAPEWPEAVDLATTEGRSAARGLLMAEQARARRTWVELSTGHGLGRAAVANVYISRDFGVPRRGKDVHGEWCMATARAGAYAVIRTDDEEPEYILATGRLRPPTREYAHDEIKVELAYTPIDSGPLGRRLTFGDALTLLALADAIETGRDWARAGILACLGLEEPKNADKPRADRFEIVNAHDSITFLERNILTAMEDVIDTGGGARTAYTFSFGEGRGLRIAEPLTRYEWLVNKALATIAGEAGPHAIFTSAQGCMAMGIRSPNKKQRAEFMGAVGHLQCVTGSIDLTLEHDKHIPKGGSAVLNGKMVNCYTGEVRAANGRVVNDGIALLDFPITFRYALQMGQLIEFPIEYLQIGDESATVRNQSLRYAVIERVYKLRHPNPKISNHIRIMRDPKNPDRAIEIEEAGFDVNDRDDRAAALRLVREMLEGLEREGLLRHYRVLNLEGERPQGHRRGSELAVVEIII